jgi:hypothetical protein
MRRKAALVDLMPLDQIGESAKHSHESYDDHDDSDMETDSFGYMAMGQDVHDDDNGDNQPPTNASGSDQPNTDRNGPSLFRTRRIMVDTGATNHMFKERHAFRTAISPPWNDPSRVGDPQDIRVK